MFTKLAEQFKNHLVNTETVRKETDKRVLTVERSTEEIRTELYKLVGDT